MQLHMDCNPSGILQHAGDDCHTQDTADWQVGALTFLPGVARRTLGLKSFEHFLDGARADIGALAYLAEVQADFKTQP